MNIIDVEHVSYAYGRATALRDVNLSVPEGALFALLGPNGSGKTTLMQVLMGLRRAQRGRVTVMGIDPAAIAPRDRARIGYVAEAQSLPERMTLREIEAYLAPLYDTWDPALAGSLRERFALDPNRRLRTLSRGERMKAALLCALAPRPRLLLMDEPFTGMDALVKDELVRGLLESSGTEGWTVLICSHDIGELEILADTVGFLDHGTVRLSEPMDVLHRRFKHVDVALPTAGSAPSLPGEWLQIERAGQRLSFLASNADRLSLEAAVAERIGGAPRIEIRDATLREIFVALAKHSVPLETAA